MDPDFSGSIRVVEFDQLVSDLFAVLFAQTFDCRETKFRVGIVARDVEQDRSCTRTAVRAEQRNRGRLKALTWIGIRFQRVGDDGNRAFFVSLKQTLQRKYFDLAVVSRQRLVHVGLATESDEQRLRVVTPGRTRIAIDQPQERRRGFVVSALFLKGVAIPVEGGVEIFVFGKALDELVEFFRGALPVLRFIRSRPSRKICIDAVLPFVACMNSSRASRCPEGVSKQLTQASSAKTIKIRYQKFY